MLSKRYHHFLPHPGIDLTKVLAKSSGGGSVVISPRPPREVFVMNAIGREGTRLTHTGLRSVLAGNGVGIISPAGTSFVGSSSL